MTDRISVRRLEIIPGEVAKCDYCERELRQFALLVRALDDEGRLEHLLLFCGHGCALASTKDDANWVIGQEAHPA